MARLPWRSDPKCSKCRRTNPEMKFGRWSDIPGIGVVASINPAHEEGLRLTCIRCGYQWLMELAPVDQPARPALPAGGPPA